jgi:hypothetical protein
MANRLKDNEDWHKDANVLVPGRYYDSIGFCYTPEMGLFGGDIYAMIWRFEDEPGNWCICMRFRYYAGENTDAFTGGDTKSPWKIWTAEDEQIENVREKLALGINVANLLTGKAPIEFDFLDIKGDSEKAGHILTHNDKPWLHCKVEKFETPNG